MPRSMPKAAMAREKLSPSLAVFAFEKCLAAHPTLIQAHVVAATHPPHPAPAQAFDFLVEGNLEAGIGDDDRRHRRR